MQSKSKQLMAESRSRVGKFVVGYVRGDTFFKTLSGSKHFKRKPAGIANDVSAIRDALNAGASWTEVTDRETGTIYRASIELINSMGIRFNEGFGNQINLLFQYWTKSLDINSKTPKRGEAKQKQGNGKRVRNHRSFSGESPRQLMFKGLALEGRMQEYQYRFYDVATAHESYLTSWL
ncbi:MAG: hypothetical protein MZU91_02185 [Desulfosudis oleivorans]|nr:hypothetical protein [Desulfosudis oleivorans]